MPQCSSREDQAKEGQSFQTEPSISSSEMDETDMSQKTYMPVYCAGILHKKCSTNSSGNAPNNQKTSANTMNENHLLLKANNCYQIHFVQATPQVCHINSNCVSSNHSQNHNQNSNNNSTNNNNNSNNNNNTNNTIHTENMLLSPSLQVVEVAPHFSKINLTPEQQYTKIHSNITLVSQSGVQHTIIPLQTISPYYIIEGLTSTLLPCVFNRSPTNQQAYIKLSNTMIQSSAANINKPQLLIQHATQKTSVLQKSSQVQLFPNTLSKSTSTCQNDVPKIMQNKSDYKDTSVNEHKKHILQNTSKELYTNDTPRCSQNVKQLEANKVPELNCRQHVKSAGNLQINSSLESPQKGSGDTLSIQNNPDNLSEKNKTQNNKTETDLDSSFDYTIEAERMVSSICNTSPTTENHTDHKISAQQDVTNTPNIFTANKITDSNFSTGNILLDALQKSVALKEQPSTICLQKAEEDWSKNTTSCTIRKTVFNHENKPSNKMCGNHYLSNNKGISMNSNNPDAENSKNHCLNTIIITNKETVLFKEAAIKCCFDIEKMIKNSELKYKDIEMECNDVRHSIFVSNRLQKLDYITDVSSGILLLIKSWVSLNKHFENFSYGVADQNKLNDSNLIEHFMQWQCISKLLIETLTAALRNDNNDKETKINENFKIFCFQSEDKSENSNKENSPFVQKCLVQDFTNSGQQNTCTPPFLKNVNRKGDENVGNVHSTSCWDTNCYSYLPKMAQPLQLTSFHKDVKTHNKLGVNSFEHQQQNLLNQKSLRSSASGCNGNNYSRYSAEDKSQNLSFMKESSVFNSKTVEPFLLQNSSTPLNHFYNSADFTNKISPSINSDFQTNASLKNQNTLLNGFKQNAVTAADLPPSSNMSANDIMPLQYTNYDSCYQYSNSHQKHALTNMTHPYLNPISNFYNFDSDDLENLAIKKIYLKPGSYNTPQKTTCSRTINNNFIIEDPPFSGVQFLYANSQTNTPKLCPSINDNSITTKNSDSMTKKSDDTWKAALASAESLCDSIMTKPSETINKIKLMRSQNNVSKLPTPDMETTGNTVKQKEASDLKCDSPSFPSPEPKFKIDDWLTQSFQTKHSQVANASFGVQINTENSENTDYNKFLKQIAHSDKSSSTSNEDLLSNFDYKVGNNNICKTGNDKNNIENKAFNVLSKAVQNDEKVNTDTKTTPRKKLTPRKLKKNSKEDFAFGSSNKYNSKRVHNLNSIKENKTMNQQTMTKLLEILDAVWKTDIKTLANNKLVNNSDKNIDDLESKIRCPLFLQAINYKLQSRAYESVDNVLIDFKKFFDQTHETNKDDEVCAELIKELEKIYITLVEKHFGINESSENKQNFGPVGSISNIKLRKQKKTQRKC